MIVSSLIALGAAGWFNGTINSHGPHIIYNLLVKHKEIVPKKALVERIPVERMIGTAAVYQALAQITGCKLGDVPKINEGELKEVAELTAKRVVAQALPRIERNYIELLDSSDPKVKLQATRDMAQTTGIIPSHAQAVIIQNSFNHQTVELTPEVVQLMQSRPSGPVIDVELDLDD